LIQKQNYRVLVTEVVGGRRGQRAGLSAAKEARGEAATSRNGRRQSGRWGVVPTSEHREILVALASLIRAQRYEIATILIEHELERSH